MDQRIPGWMNLTFLLVGVISTASLGLILAVAVEAINPKMPETVLGPLLCPAETQLKMSYVRKLGGGVSETLMECVGPNGDQHSVNSASLFLWYGLFMLPMLLLTPLIVRGLQKHNQSQRGATTSSKQTWTTNSYSHNQVYTDLSGLPPEAQEAFERLSTAFEDRNRNGIPDIFEGGNVQVIDLQGTAGTQPNQSDPAQKLIKLKELLDAGLITQQEYDTKRAEIVAKL